MRIIEMNTGAELFRGTLAQCEWWIDEKGYRIVADNDMGDTYWVKRARH
jgi:hypothetical protein